MTDIFILIRPYWQSFLGFFGQKQITSNLTATVVFILVVITVRFVASSWLKHTAAWNEPSSLVWRHRLRIFTWSFVTLVLVIIWAPQLRTFAVSVVAVAAALVLALKELITCITGAFVRANLEGVDVGARLTVGNVRGDIVRYDLLSTTFSEVNEAGQRTGHIVILPNSAFLTQMSVVEATADRSFATLIVTVPMKKDADWQKVETVLLQEATERVAEVLPQAKRYVTNFKRRTGFPLPSPEPRVYLEWPDAEKILIHLRVVAPISEHHRLRQEILRAVLAEAKTA